MAEAGWKGVGGGGKTIGWGGGGGVRCAAPCGTYTAYDDDEAEDYEVAGGAAAAAGVMMMMSCEPASQPGGIFTTPLRIIAAQFRSSVQLFQVVQGAQFSK